MSGFLNGDWWSQEKDNVHSDLWNTFQSIKDQDSYRTELDLQNLRLYGNHNVLGFDPASFTKFESQERLTYNLCRAVADTIVSQVARHEVRPVFLTSGGNESLRRKSKNLSMYVEGTMYATEIRKKMPLLALDAVVFGKGAIHPYIHHNKICVDRILPGELYVDQLESLYGRPQSLYRRRWINKERLAAAFPKYTGQIEAAAEPANELGPGLLSATSFATTGQKQIEIIEAWHLPSKPGGKDGRHVISIQNCTILDEPYKHDSFPFVFLNYGERLMGFWGVGAVENLTPIQVELNRTLIKLQKMYHLMAAGRVFVEAGSGLKKNQINNDIGSVYTYKGSPPIFAPPTPVGPEIFNYINMLIERGFSQEGVSPFMASGQKPAGISSGVGIREAEEIQMGKLSQFMQNWDEAHLDLAKWFVRLGKELSKKKGGHKIVAHQDRNTIAHIDWADVDLEEDQYVLKVYPSSNLPKEPSGRLDQVVEMLQYGLVDPAEAKRLLDFPDLEKSQALDRAASDAIDRQIELMLDEGIPQVPEPFQDQALALKRAQAAYNLAVVQGVPDSNLQLVRTYMMAANENINLAQQAQAQIHAQTAAATQPGAGPAPGFDGAPPNAVGGGIP